VILVREDFFELLLKCLSVEYLASINSIHFSKFYSLSPFLRGKRSPEEENQICAFWQFPKSVLHIKFVA
jgi:hypothetical protein